MVSFNRPPIFPVHVLLARTSTCFPDSKALVQSARDFVSAGIS